MEAVGERRDPQGEMTACAQVRGAGVLVGLRLSARDMCGAAVGGAGQPSRALWEMLSSL